MWHRVFGLKPDEVSPSQLVEHLHSLGLSVEPHFKGDDLGWTAGELHLPGGSPVRLERFLTSEDELRRDLNTFAAELETMTFAEHRNKLMQHCIQTQQMIVLRRPSDHSDDATLENVCVSTLQFLATQTDGIYQIDGEGWFAVDGECLLQEY